MAGYWIVRGSAIRDQAAADEYVKRWGAIAERYGAEVIAGKGRIDTREGEDFPRQLVIRFPSFADAVKCYEDPDYVEAMKYSSQAFDRDLSILEGS